MKYRIATLEDLNALADLRWDFIKEDGGDIAVSKPDFRNVFRNWSQQYSNHFHFIAEEDNNIISVMSLFIIDPLPRPIQHNPAWGYLTNVYTVPEKRGKGIASELIRFVKNHIHERQLETVIAWPSDEGIAFYERAGFIQHNKIMELQTAISFD